MCSGKSNGATSNRANDLLWRISSRALLLGFNGVLIGVDSQYVFNSVSCIHVKYLLGPARVSWLAGMGLLDLALFFGSVGALCALSTHYASDENNDKIDKAVINFTLSVAGLTTFLRIADSFARD
jgi:uncharacterized membrane protein YsdA (DUF1294 family)